MQRAGYTAVRALQVGRLPDQLLSIAAHAVMSLATAASVRKTRRFSDMTSDPLAQLRYGQLTGARRLDLSCGLEEFPREIFDLADTLEVLNLTGNRLATLPDDLGRLHKLRILFCSENQFEHLPESVGTCPSLSMVGFKSNAISRVPEASLPPSLRWLILTDNRVETLPDSLGRCAPLQKLMLSGNRLHTLPATLRDCTNLEMLRLAANEFETLPDWLLQLPRLAWLALAGNPCAPTPALESVPARWVRWQDLQLIELLGEGASGFIHRARWLGTQGELPDEVAVKVFKGAMTSDGLPECELAASLTAGAHAGMIETLARIVDHPTGSPALVMSLIEPEFQSLAGPPSLDSCTRDVYPPDCSFTPTIALRMAHSLASAAEHLHRHGLMHGDFYAHNVLWNATGDCKLGDFGAASFYPAAHAKALQQIEARAFGYLLSELIERTPSAAFHSALAALHSRCVSEDRAARPLFAEITQALAGYFSGGSFAL